MALMARSVGIPARVVVGFTQGAQEGNQWVVRGTDAHAWPELWMGSAGWVRFEPTPGAPTATRPAYTSTTQVPEGPTAAPTQSAAAPTASSTDVPAQVPDELAGASEGQGSGSDGLPLRWIVGVLVLIGLLVPAVVRLVRRRRRLRTGDGESAYREVVDTLVDLRLGVESSTPRTTVAEVGGLLVSVGGGSADGSASVGTAEAQQALARILRAVEWQRYGSPSTAAPSADGDEPPGAAAQSGARAGGVLVAERQDTSATDARPGALAGDVRTVRRALARRAGWVRRVVGALVPRSLR